MKALRILLCVAAIFVCNAIVAQTEYMRIKQKNGTVTEIKVSDVENITFNTVDDPDVQSEAIVGKWIYVGYDDAGWGAMLEDGWESGDIIYFKADGEYIVKSSAGKLQEKGKWKIIAEGKIRLYDCVDYTDDNCTILPWNAFYTIEGNILTLEVEFFGFKMFMERDSSE